MVKSKEDTVSHFPLDAQGTVCGSKEANRRSQGRSFPQEMPGRGHPPGAAEDSGLGGRPGEGEEDGGQRLGSPSREGRACVKVCTSPGPALRTASGVFARGVSFSLERDQVTAAPQPRGAPRRGHPRARAALRWRGRRGRRAPRSRQPGGWMPRPGAPTLPTRTLPSRFPAPSSRRDSPRLPPSPGLLAHRQTAPRGLRLRPPPSAPGGGEGGRGRRRRRRGGGGGGGGGGAGAEARSLPAGRGGRGGHSSETLLPPHPSPPRYCSVPRRTPSSLLAPFGPWVPQSFSGVRFSVLFLPLSLQPK